MKFIEIYTYYDGDIMTGVHHYKWAAMRALKTSMSDKNDIIESVVISLDENGNTERVAYWKKA